MSHIEICPICGEDYFIVHVNEETNEKESRCTKCGFVHKVSNVDVIDPQEDHLINIEFFANPTKHIVGAHQINTIQDMEHQILELEHAHGIHSISVELEDADTHQTVRIVSIIPES